MSEDEVEPVEPPDPGTPSLVERLLPPVEPLGEDGQPKASRMDHREQLVAAGLGFANVAIAAGAATGVERQQALVLLVGLLASTVTLVGARAGNRIVAILGLFACVVTRNATTFVFLAFGLPYYAAAMWMYLRFTRIGNDRRRAQRAAAKGSTATAPKRSRATSGQAAAAAKPRPTQSKRYTPPKPPKKRPPPPPKPPRDRSIVD